MVPTSFLEAVGRGGGGGDFGEIRPGFVMHGLMRPAKTSLHNEQEDFDSIL